MGKRISSSDYEHAKKTLDQINDALTNQPMTDAKRRELHEQAAAISGSLLSIWFPIDWPRRLIMFGILAFGIQQAIAGNFQALFLWLLLPLFSPRIVGGAAYAAGRITSLFR